MKNLSLFICIVMLGACKEKGSFKKDVSFLKNHTEIIVLSKGNGAIAIAPQYQGRVMTSTTDSSEGIGFGWINKKVVRAGFLSEDERKGKLEDQIYIFGGEERFWLGPEGGQYALFFKPGSSFDFSEWKTPAAIDTDSFQLVKRTENMVGFEHQCELLNYNGTIFSMKIERNIRLLDKTDVENIIKEKLSDEVDYVAYETDNRITNVGDDPWIAETGLPSIWLLGMYNPSPKTTVVIPFKDGDPSLLGAKVKDDYFGKVPKEYLRAHDNILFLKGDGTKRSKIGINPKRTKGIAGSYDADQKIITVVTYNVQDAPNGFVNSSWEYQDEPYSGDVINAYNDGSPKPGTPPLGPFYELETSSPAAALIPGETMVHKQVTIHFQGDNAALEIISREVFGVGLEDINTSFTE
ncbi:DUF6786 family protein [Maribacter sp. TH_r10]|uniref:DUF6786 family protein n=1 Tax=Maribacter sp. TH_r10 TaxID=3082086 RepID=UPI002954DBF5|nr:DUF6786 family protein [Maribacter sp. TH_r10]MDV7139114.1 DUF6786 family protein [Maribacter sp. TH_r10]